MSGNHYPQLPSFPAAIIEQPTSVSIQIPETTDSRLVNRNNPGGNNCEGSLRPECQQRQQQQRQHRKRNHDIKIVVVEPPKGERRQCRRQQRRKSCRKRRFVEFESLYIRHRGGGSAGPAGFNHDGDGDETVSDYDDDDDDDDSYLVNIDDDDDDNDDDDDDDDGDKSCINDEKRRFYTTAEYCKRDQQNLFLLWIVLVVLDLFSIVFCVFLSLARKPNNSE